MKFLSNVDLTGNELRTAVIEVRTSDPASGKVGQVYYNSSTSKLRVCTVAGSPGTWQDLLIGPIGSGDITDGSIVNADISSSAAIALSKLAVDPLARGNHTGTQLASTISDFTTQRDAQRLDQHAAPTNPVNLNGQRITALADPNVATDAATKNYVDGAVAGFAWKPSVRVASTGNVNIASPGASIDGKSLALQERVLLKDQTTPSQNGIYVWTGAAGAMVRASDADAWGEFIGAAVIVEEGTVNGDTAWLCTVDRGGTLGTTAVTWTQFPGAGSLIAGNGLTRTGNQLDVGAGTGITVAADSVAIDTTVVASKASAQFIGNGALTQVTVLHNLNTDWPLVEVWEVATRSIVGTEVTSTDANNIVVKFGSAPASGATYVVKVVG